MCRWQVCDVAFDSACRLKSHRYQVPVRQHRCLLDSHVCLLQQTALLSQPSIHARHSGHSANIPSHPASVAAFRSLFLEHRVDFNDVIRRSLVVMGSGSLKRFLPFLSQSARCVPRRHPCNSPAPRGTRSLHVSSTLESSFRDKADAINLSALAIASVKQDAADVELCTAATLAKAAADYRDRFTRYGMLFPCRLHAPVPAHVRLRLLPSATLLCRSCV